MRALYLHVGQPCTGSSFIQAVLANSVDALAAEGIGYRPGKAAQAGGWTVSSGNGAVLDRMDARPGRFQMPGTLFSSESLAERLTTEPAFRDRLARICEANGVTEVRILMFVRDPVAHAESSYQQQVKRFRATYDVSEGFRNFRMPALARQFLETDLGLPSTEMTVLNFDRHRGGLRNVLARFLGVAPEVLADPGRRGVNRSMTRAELALLRAMNGPLKQGAGFLAEELCNRLPETPPDHQFPPVEEQEAMVARLQPDMDAVNDYLLPEETYRVQYVRRPRKWPETTFSPEQIQVIGEVTGGTVSEARRMNVVLRIDNALLKARIFVDNDRVAQAREELGRAGQLLDRIGGFAEMAEQHRKLSERLDRLTRRADAADPPQERRLH